MLFVVCLIKPGNLYSTWQLQTLGALLHGNLEVSFLSQTWRFVMR